MKKKRHSEVLMMRVTKGALEPADEYTKRRLRDKGFHVGDLLGVELRKLRNPGFHKLVHVFGQMVAENIESFAGLTAHGVLKRLQIEANIGCEEISCNVHWPQNAGEDFTWAIYRIPLSLSFASMDEAEFFEVFRGMCEHISKTYWPDMTPEQIEQMAELMPSVA